MALASLEGIRNESSKGDDADAAAWWSVYDKVFLKIERARENKVVTITLCMYTHVFNLRQITGI